MKYQQIENQNLQITLGSTDLSAIENQLKIVMSSDHFPVFVICDNLKDLIAHITANLQEWYPISSCPSGVECFDI
jgi:hypothetical protein